MAASTQRIIDAEVARLARMLRKREDRVVETKRKLADAKARAKHAQEKTVARKTRKAQAQ